MSNEKRYSVWAYVHSAERNGPDWVTWNMAKREYDDLEDPDYRIFDHSTTPPTDVTDADPEAEAEPIRWWCTWTPKSFDAEPAYASSAGGYFEWDSEGRATMANAAITSATEPTFAEFAAAVKDATGVEIPQSEKPKWWWWNGKEWEPLDYDPTLSSMYQAMLWCGESKCKVFGTRDTIDAKRDRLLAAAREAGKP